MGYGREWLGWVGSPVHQAANELKMNNVIIVM